MAKTAIEFHQLSPESVKLINELWETLELVWGHKVSVDELKAQIIEPDGQIMDEYHLRQRLLKAKTAWKGS